jgi:hypothetical protein
MELLKNQKKVISMVKEDGILIEKAIYKTL